MDASLYSAMSAAKQYSQLQEIASNNIANSKTNGFKADKVSFKALYLNSPNAINTVAYTELNSAGIDLSQGAINFTNNKNDLVSEGMSFFSLLNQDGEEFYTKTVSILRDNQGALINSDGARLLDKSGKFIFVGDKDFSISKRGEVVLNSHEGKQILTSLKTSNLTTGQVLKSERGQIIAAEDNSPVQDRLSSVLVGYKEASNVNSMSSMTQLMSSKMNYELSAKMMATVKNIHASSNKLIAE